MTLSLFFSAQIYFQEIKNGGKGWAVWSDEHTLTAGAEIDTTSLENGRWACPWPSSSTSRHEPWGSRACTGRYTVRLHCHQTNGHPPSCAGWTPACLCRRPPHCPPTPPLSNLPAPLAKHLNLSTSHYPPPPSSLSHSHFPLGSLHRLLGMSLSALPHVSAAHFQQKSQKEPVKTQTWTKAPSLCSKPLTCLALRKPIWPFMTGHGHAGIWSPAALHPTHLAVPAAPEFMTPASGSLLSLPHLGRPLGAQGVIQLTLLREAPPRHFHVPPPPQPSSLPPQVFSFTALKTWNRPHGAPFVLCLTVPLECKLLQAWVLPLSVYCWIPALGIHSKCLTYGIDWAHTTARVITKPEASQVWLMEGFIYTPKEHRQDSGSFCFQGAPSGEEGTATSFLWTSKAKSPSPGPSLWRVWSKHWAGKTNTLSVHRR